MQNFIARQKIVNANQDVLAFELLFRDGINNVFDFHDRDLASLSVMESSLNLFGMQALTGGRKAFINVTREVLTQSLVHRFPTDIVVPEILEDIAEDAETVAACMRLKTAGYQIALDDIVSLDQRNVIFQLADIVKVDFVDTDEIMQRRIAERFRNTRTTLLAEKIETPDEFQYARHLGYTLFQGYLFGKPEIRYKRTLPAAYTGQPSPLALVG